MLSRHNHFACVDLLAECYYLFLINNLWENIFHKEDIVDYLKVPRF
jgi:hypothetical protein